MSSDSKALRHNFTASTASLGRVPGVDFDDLATGPFSLVADHQSEHPKPSVVGRQCEVLVAGHKREGQVFNRDQSIRLSKLVRGFVPEVSSLILDAFVEFGDRRGSFAPAATPILPSGETALGSAKVREFFPQPARVLVEGFVN